MDEDATGHAGQTPLVNWALIILIYVAWMLITWFHQAMPIWVLMPFGAVVIAWHGSFQHEAVHNHFSKSPWLNDLPVYPPLALWLPFPIYRGTHRVHHNFSLLTDPIRDPESFYVDQASWASLPEGVRRLLIWHNTLMGRLLLGPFLVIGQFFYGEAKALLQGDHRHLRAWLLHVPASAAVLVWIVIVVDMPVLTYLGCFVLPGLSLTLVRSFAEHKAANTPLERTAIVEAGPFFSLLFLNNNLHFAHHRRPDLPWQALPAYYRRHRAMLLEENGGLYYPDGYREIAHRFLTHPVDRPEHPFC